jgi:hypothetical protein
MSLYKSFNDLYIYNDPKGTILEGTTYDEDGNKLSSQIILDDYIGNEDGIPRFSCIHIQSGPLTASGRFVWDGRNVSESAVYMTLQRIEDRAILRAGLQRGDRTWNHNQQIDLSEKIANVDGEMKVV